jgi:hypothetical protein
LPAELEARQPPVSDSEPEGALRIGHIPPKLPSMHTDPSHVSIIQSQPIHPNPFLLPLPLAGEGRGEGTRRDSHHLESPCA